MKSIIARVFGIGVVWTVGLIILGLSIAIANGPQIVRDVVGILSLLILFIILFTVFNMFLYYQCGGQELAEWFTERFLNEKVPKLKHGPDGSGSEAGTDAYGRTDRCSHCGICGDLYDLGNCGLQRLGPTDSRCQARGIPAPTPVATGR
jgi:hypothetical protein